MSRDCFQWLSAKSQTMIMLQIVTVKIIAGHGQLRRRSCALTLETCHPYRMKTQFSKFVKASSKSGSGAADCTALQNEQPQAVNIHSTFERSPKYLCTLKDLRSCRRAGRRCPKTCRNTCDGKIQTIGCIWNWGVMDLVHLTDLPVVTIHLIMMHSKFS